MTDDERQEAEQVLIKLRDIAFRTKCNVWMDKEDLRRNEIEVITAALNRKWNEALEKAAKILDNWSSFYPVDLFGEPPPGQHGKTVASCAAAAIRAICPSIAAKIRILKKDTLQT